MSSGLFTNTATGWRTKEITKIYKLYLPAQYVDKFISFVQIP